MTQHTDMGGLARREQIARIIDPDAWHPMLKADGCGVHWHVRRNKALTKADDIEALSIPQGLGEGLVLVPREPTEAMLEACKPWPSHWPKDGPDFPAMNAACLTDRMAARFDWQRMIDAAPQPPANPSEEQVERAAKAICAVDRGNSDECKSCRAARWQFNPETNDDEPVCLPDGCLGCGYLHLAQAALTAARAQ